MSVTVHGATPAPAAKHAALHDPNMSHRLVTSVRAYKPLGLSNAAPTPFSPSAASAFTLARRWWPRSRAMASVRRSSLPCTLAECKVLP